MSRKQRVKSYFRMSSEAFNIILNAISEVIKKRSTNWRKAISPEEKLVVTLRYLATGSAFHTLAYSFRMGVSTVADIVKEVCTVIWYELHNEYLPIPNQSIMVKTAEEIYRKWNFPNCFGCVDSRHTRIKCPSNTGSQFFNYKQYFSIVLQGVADASYKFLTIDVGAYGRQSDGGVFKDSALYTCLQQNAFGQPLSAKLPNSTKELPYVLLGDEAYPLMPYLLRPYPRQNLNAQKSIFNYRLSRARRCVECAFGIMTAKWRIFTRALDTDPTVSDQIIKTVCLLHNIVLTVDGIDTTTISPENSAGSTKLAVTSHRPIQYARESFCEYFNNEGAVPWQ